MPKTEDRLKALEKQLKDIKGAYTRSRQELSRTKAALDTVQTFSFDPGVDEDELRKLKTEDPDAWKAKLVDIEAARKAALEASIAKAGDAASAQARADMLADALKDSKLTLDALKDELPAKYFKDYEQGKLDEYELVQKAQVYMGAAKVLNSPTTPDGIDFSMVAGGNILGSDKPDIEADPNDSIV